MPLSSRDYDLISAYLDGDVSNDERREAEGRLEADPEFAAELDALRRTIALVKGMPTLTALRDFRLTPDMIGDQQPVPATEPTRYPPLRPSFRRRMLQFAPNLVAAAASFVLVLAGAFTLLTAPAGAPTDGPAVALVREGTDLVEAEPTITGEAEADDTMADTLQNEDGSGAGADALSELGLTLPAESPEGSAAEDMAMDAADADAASRAAQPQSTDPATDVQMFESAPLTSVGAVAPPAPTRTAPADTEAPSAAMAAPGTFAATAEVPTLKPASTPAPLPTPTMAATSVAQAPPPAPEGSDLPQRQSAGPAATPVLGIVLLAAGAVLGLLALILRPRLK